MLRARLVTAVTAACVVALAAALSGCGQFAPTYLKPLSPQTQAKLAETRQQLAAPPAVAPGQPATNQPSR